MAIFRGKASVLMAVPAVLPTPVAAQSGNAVVSGKLVGRGPDLGAFELDAPLPDYGPRAWPLVRWRSTRWNSRSGQDRRARGASSLLSR